jgi:hypothetical protein
MGGNRMDELGAAGGGLVIALSFTPGAAAVRTLPQFSDLKIPDPDQISV